MQRGLFGFEKAQRPALKLYAPKIMSAETNRDELLSLIYDYQYNMFALSRTERRRITGPLVVDLSKVEHLSLDAALVLTAEYHRQLLLNPDFKPLIDDRDWAPEIRSLLDDLGFYELVSPIGRTSDHSNSAPIESRMKFVRFLSGEKVEQREARKLIESLKAAAGQEPEHEYIYVALVEAIKNVKHHAYLGGQVADAPPSVSRWWAAGAYNPESRLLQFAVYDQGIGIPATLPRRSFWQSIRKLCPLEFSDADVIAGGIEYSRSRYAVGSTADENFAEGRGNGLWAICHFIPQLDGSFVRIVSGRGEAIFSGGASVDRKEHANPFCGTLIQWTLKLPHTAQSGGAAE